MPEFSPLPEQLVTSPAASSSALSAVASDHQYQQQTSPQVCGRALQLLTALHLLFSPGRVGPWLPAVIERTKGRVDERIRELEERRLVCSHGQLRMVKKISVVDKTQRSQSKFSSPKMGTWIVFASRKMNRVTLPGPPLRQRLTSTSKHIFRLITSESRTIFHIEHMLTLRSCSNQRFLPLGQ